MSSVEKWGVGPFDNSVAQELAFKISCDSAFEDLGFVEKRLSKPTKKFVDCLELVALADLVNLTTGYSDHGIGCPLLLHWVLSKKIKPPAVEIQTGLADKLRAVCVAENFLAMWDDLASDWQAEVSAIADKLTSGKKARAVKANDISIKTLKALVADRPGREPDSVFPMARGSNDLHLNFSCSSPQVAVAMTRYPSVVSLMLNLSEPDDEVESVTPYKILLRRWKDTIRHLECDVSTKEWSSHLLDACVLELSLLSNLEVFQSDQFAISDEVVGTLAQAKHLSELRISCDGDGPTAKCLEAMKGHPSLKVLWLRGSRIPKKAVATFVKAHPNIDIDID